MANLFWNPGFNRIEFRTGGKGRGAVYLLFEGGCAKSVRLEMMTDAGVISDLVKEICTCTNGSDGRDVPCAIDLLPDQWYALTPLYGVNCSTLPDTKFPETPVMPMLQPNGISIAGVYEYHCHVTDRDNVHITIVIEDASDIGVLPVGGTGRMKTQPDAGPIPGTAVDGVTSRNGTIVIR